MKNKCFFDSSECLEEKNLSLYVITNNKMQLQNCCSKCIAKLENSMNQSTSEENFIDLTQNSLPVDNLSEKMCSSCKSTFNDLLKTAKIGCPLCYTYFEKELKILIQHYQNCLKHKGKKPSNCKSVLIHNVFQDLKYIYKNSKTKDKKNILKLLEKIYKI